MQINKVCDQGCYGNYVSFIYLYIHSIQTENDWFSYESNFMPTNYIYNKMDK